jgi:hypothetical protein
VYLETSQKGKVFGFAILVAKQDRRLLFFEIKIKRAAESGYKYL